VWKGKHCGRDVAVKVMRTFSNIDLQKIIGVGCCCLLFPCAGALTDSCAEVLQGGRNMESPSTSECHAANRSDDVRDPVRCGNGLDGEWKYQ